MLSKIILGVGSLLLLFAATAALSETSSDTIILEKGNFTAISGEVSPTSVQEAINDIGKSDSKKPFYLFIDSPGGSVFAGRKFVDYLKSTDRDIICIANTAISMAFIILETCKTRLVTDDAVLMTHQISSGAQGSLKELKTMVGLMDKLETYYDTLIAKRLGITLEQYRKLIDPEYWLLGSEEIIKAKAADKETKVSCSIELEKEKTMKRTMGLFGPVEIETSACPLM